MGLPTHIGQLFFAENAYRPICGDVGFLGRQTTFLRPRTLEALARMYSFVPKPTIPVEFDKDTRQADFVGGAYVTDRYLMNYLGARSFKAIDVSAYEGADIVLDICDAVPAHLHGSFDFIYDGSCIDNVFDPAGAIRNISRLLRPGGRAVLFNHATWFNAPYGLYSPGWYFDFFAANGYADCQVFLGFFKESDELFFGPMRTFFFNWAGIGKVGNIPEGLRDYEIAITVIAEKAPDSTDAVNPVQLHYRDKSYDQTTFRQNGERIIRSARRHFGVPADLFAVPETYIRTATLAADLPL